MRLISKDDGTWEMQRIRELEFLMLSKLEDACDPDGSKAALDRLFPSPLGRPSVDDKEDELVADWEDLVHPDLLSQFKSSIGVVVADMRNITSRKRSGEMEYRLIVPKKHADDWCSTLNQARLILHEHHKLPEEEFELDMEGGHEQWLAILQSEIYGSIMEFLVTRILWLK
ncbi:MAG: DUF2017 family protein [Verrucomicrobiales bacterium]